MTGFKTAIFGLLLLAAATPAAAEELNFKNLPGVYPQGDLNAPTPKTNCTSELVETYGPGPYRTGLPERIYSCGEGNISVYSTVPPSGLQRVNPDPYIHGEAQLGTRDYGAEY